MDSLDGKIDKAGLAAATTSAAIAIDKMQLLRGNPTEIRGNIELEARRKQAAEELAAKYNLPVEQVLQDLQAGEARIN